MKFKLQQEYSPDTKTGNPQALLLPQSSTDRLLETIFSFELDERDYQVYPLPVSADVSNLNAFFITFTGNRYPQKVVLGIPYQKFGNKLYHPDKSRLYPAITKEEFSEKLIYDICVFTASGEFYGFNYEDQILVEDLFSPPPEIDSSWDRIHPGFSSPPRLISISAPAPDDKEEILNQMQDNIGTIETKEINKLKNYEKSQGITRGLANKIESGVLKSLLRITDSIPEKPNGALWINELERWAAKKLNKLVNSRQLETENLLKLLKENPDLGLKYALPIGHHGAAARGEAEESYRLGARDTNFNLANLGQSHAVDFWNIDDGTIAQLHTRYRELGNREISNNNHRRAAYIFAHLLGDYHSAANALKQGKYFNEAAAVFEKHLNNPLEAANCLKEGGLFQAAIKIYVKHNKFMQAAALYKKMSQPENEKEMYLKAADKHMADRSYIEAANIHDSFLKDPDAAFKVLDENWLHKSSHNSTESVLKHYFMLLDKHGRYEQCYQKLQEIYDNQPLDENQISLMKALLYLGNLSQEKKIKEYSSDFVTSIAAQVLMQGNSNQKKSVMMLLPGRDSFDSLLMRDCSTFLRNIKEPEIKTILYGSKFKKQFLLVSQISLDTKERRYLDVISAGDEIYCAGAIRKQAFVAKLTTTLQPKYIKWDTTLPEESDLHLLVTPDEQNLVLWSSHSEHFSQTSFSNDSGFNIKVGQFPWFPAKANSVGIHDSGSFAIARENSVALYSDSGKLYETIALQGHEAISENIVHFEDGYFLGRGKFLIRIEGKKAEYKESKWTIKSICRTFLQSEVRIAICFQEETGAEIFWPKSDWRRGYSLAHDLDVQHICFNRDADLVVFNNDGKGEAYTSVGKKLTKLYDININCRIIKIAPGLRINEFLILTESDLLSYSLQK